MNFGEVKWNIFSVCSDNDVLSWIDFYGEDLFQDGGGSLSFSLCIYWEVLIGVYTCNVVDLRM